MASLRRTEMWEVRSDEKGAKRHKLGEVYADKISEYLCHVMGVKVVVEIVLWTIINTHLELTFHAARLEMKYIQITTKNSLTNKLPHGSLALSQEIEFFQ